MDFFKFVIAEAQTPIRRIALMALAAGVTNGIILAIINFASEAVANGYEEPLLFLAFLCAIGVVSITHKQLIRLSAREVEGILHRLRTEMVSRLCGCDMAVLEMLGGSAIQSVMAQEMQVISRNIPQIVNAVQAAVLVFFSSIYLLLLSPPAFGVMMVVVLLGTLLYIKRAQLRLALLAQAFKGERDVVAAVADVIGGAKEIRFNSARARDVISHFEKISATGGKMKSDAMIAVAEDYVTGRTLFYIILLAEIFVAPIFAQDLGVEAQKATAVILFLMWPVNSVLLAMSVVEMVNVAVRNIQEMRQALSGLDGWRDVTVDRTSFREIRCDQVEFAYAPGRDEAPFTIGPISLTIRSGEVTFITGGNGYGKSTFLKVLSGLYKPTAGRICLDGVPVTDYGSYRSLVASVFTDYHLFQSIHGLRGSDPATIATHMQTLGLSHKVTVENDRFSTLALSAGQRKRLALLVAILEERPLLVLDEWAAEQDPGFRRTFYEEIIPWLRSSGRTVVAVTHDDRYFHIADRRLTMRNGNFVEEDAA